MRALAELKAPSQVDPKYLHRIFFIDHFCLSAVGIIALINVFPGIVIPLGKDLPAGTLHMRSPCVAMTLCAVLALYLSEATQCRLTKGFGIVFSSFTSAIAAMSLLTIIVSSPYVLRWVLDRTPVALREASLQFSCGAFLLLGSAILVGSIRGNGAGRIANGLTFILSFLVFSLVLEFLFTRAGIAGSSTSSLIPAPTLFCIALLTFVLALRRIEQSSLSLLFGYGTGGRIARLLAPIIILLPMLREIARAHLLRTGWIPAPYALAFLTSVGTLVGLILLSILVRIANRMQERIQNYALKDELTGLFSLKGFYLLAEQSFRQSRRSEEPYAVLFVDMDNLKIINDKLGHSMGSVSLVETAKLLTANFRDTDIIGRVGGDEFIVAGQFSGPQIAAAVQRLREAVSRKNEAVGQQFSLSLSMGCAVTEDLARETLQGLVARADEAMYEEKRGKKNRRTAAVPQVDVLSLEVVHSDDGAFDRVGI